MTLTTDNLTKLLRAWTKGDASALDPVLPAVVSTMRLIARRIPKHGATINTTAVVNEAWLRIAAGSSDITDREHFFALAARAMRQVLIDHSRTCHRRKRGGGAQIAALTEDSGLTEQQIEQLLIINDLLDRLESEQPRRCRVFEMRFFAGFSVDEVAQELRVSANTVIRDYRLACAWLRFHFEPSALKE